MLVCISIQQTFYCLKKARFKERPMQTLELTFPRECCQCNLWTATRLWTLSGKFFASQWYSFFSSRNKQPITIRVPVCEGCFKDLQAHKNEPAAFRNGKLIFYNEEYQRKFTALNNDLESKAKESERNLKHRPIG